MTATLADLVDRIGDLAVAAASSAWVRSERGRPVASVCFARSADGRWWSEEDGRGTLLYDGVEWWRGPSRFRLRPLREWATTSPFVSRRRMIQSMLVPRMLCVWGDAGSTHVPVRHRMLAPATVTVRCEPREHVSDPGMDVTVDLRRGFVETISKRETTFRWASLALEEPPEWLFLGLPH